ncbi:hypothetical protein DBR44_02460 [Aquitalea sp. FJL05]|uniref:hypothetical protein n=1 Tax=Aquitalea TaxID=407217 RepID=UPI000F5A4F99|nr:MULTISPECIES: hypothetical protein [Aquitalea]RQO77492.1 hypothetical protein DBR44_02460 [Aquitalea sp. FJL05]
MARQNTISSYLPVTFPNGNRVRRFGKHCPHCHAMVGCEHMAGLASLQQDKLFLAAQGTCPACQHRFPIACVITDDKRVHRVLLPLWVYRMWLQMATRNTPQPVAQANWEVQEENTAPAQQGILLTDAEVAARSPEILGRFQDQPISAWIEYQDRRFVFERAAPPGQFALSEQEVLLAGKLIYRQQDIATTA